MKKLFSLLLFLPLMAALCAALPSASAAGPGGSISVRFYNEETKSYENQIETDLVQLSLDGAALIPGDVPALMHQIVPGESARTLVPVRLVAEKLGAEVLWIQENRQVLLLQGEKTILLTLGSAEALVDGQSMELPDGVPAGIVKYQGRESTMVPLRFVSEQLGAQVGWDNETFTALITTEATPEPEPDPAPELKEDLGVLTAILSNPAAQTLQLVTDHSPAYQVTDLGDRLVVDVLGTQMPGTDYLPHTIPVDNDLIRAVRYAQHGDSLENGYRHTVRVVLDLQDGVSYAEHFTITDQRDGILITAKRDGSTDSTPADPDKPVIIVDPGHGGIHPGAVYEGVLEKDLTLAISLKLRDELTALGYNAILLRETDQTIDIYDRAYIANALNADLYVSIHCNASDTVPTYQGAYTYYYPGSEKGGAALAQAIQGPLCQLTGAIDRGIRSADFVVLRETEMCAVLVETGFMSNSEELARLCDPEYQGKVARGVALGVKDYLDALALETAAEPAEEAAGTAEAIPAETPEGTPEPLPEESPAA